jgi:hypothetical protein
MLGRKPLACSFCGKGEAEVTKLVAGPKVYICNKCVALAARIIEGDAPDQNKTHPTFGPVFWSGSVLVSVGSWAHDQLTALYIRELCLRRPKDKHKTYHLGITHIILI